MVGARYGRLLMGILLVMVVLSLLLTSMPGAGLR